MTEPFNIPRPPLPRRAFLRATGAGLALPLLDAMLPAVRGAAPPPEPPRRMLLIQTNQGLLSRNFFPAKAGRDYEAPAYLKLLKAHRERFTVFSGLSHPGVDGGHDAEVSFLTGAVHPGAGGFKNTISLDQFAAEQIGTRTRLPSLSVLIGESRVGLSYTRSGVGIPCETSPSAIYRRLFLQGDAKETEARVKELRVGRSVLDFVRGEARRLERDLGPADRDRLDQYFTSVRDLERQFVESAAWERRPKPKTSVPEPRDIDVKDNSRVIERMGQMAGVLRLALETDSTRLITVFVSHSSGVPKVPGVKEETHTLTHHGNWIEAINQLARIESAVMAEFAGLLDGLASARERGGTLLDRTMVLLGSCMGDANIHSNTNLPILLAGGGFKHGQHLAFDPKDNQPLARLFVSMLQRLGLETDRFSTGRGTLRGLEAA